ncbi:MAG: DUF1385 domain-containing protein [Candidatus Bathyarchaeota archaeon]|nr:MAG: DUF1385 domain-containing protein [Candidatus Bathyarchaeota archaeon]
MKLTARGRDEPSLAFGGQAVIEGVMFRSKKHMVVCVRQPNGEILTKTEEITSLSETYRILKIPFIRGIVALFETLYLGVKGLYFSANVSLEEEEEKIEPKEMVVAFVFAMALAIFLFSIFPFFLTTLFRFTGLIFNVVEGIIRVAIFILYLLVVASIGEFRKVLEYHGAEHTVINAYEAGVELSIPNAKKYSRLHPRCGTSFLFIVLIISILLFSLVPSQDFATRLSYRIILIPVISSISYEILKISDRYKKSIFMKILVTPGLGIQYLTTRNPDEEKIAVALTAVQEVNKLSQQHESKNGNDSERLK